jgi:hypothetical protein
VNPRAQTVSRPSAYLQLERRTEMTRARQESARERMLTIAEENQEAREFAPGKHGVRLLQS